MPAYFFSHKIEKLCAGPNIMASDNMTLRSAHSQRAPAEGLPPGDFGHADSLQCGIAGCKRPSLPARSAALADSDVNG